MTWTLNNRWAVLRGTATLIGSMYQLRRKNVWRENAVRRLIFAQHIVQQWLVDYLRYHVIIFGILAHMMNKWMVGVAKILKCHSEFGNVSFIYQRKQNSFH